MMSNEERERLRREMAENTEAAQTTNKRFDEYQRSRGLADIPPELLSERNQKLQNIAQAYSHPRVLKGTRGLPYNHYTRYVCR